MLALFREFIQYPFMKYALLAVIMITPLLAMLGTMIVHKKMAYFSDALGHCALTGIAIGVVFGMTDTSLSMIIFAVVFALLLNQIKFKNPSSTDTIISVFASVSLAIGLAILSKGGNFSKYSSILVGDILSISKLELFYLLITLIFTIIFWCVAINGLTAVSIHPSLAKSHHIKTKLLENIFVVLIAVIVMLSIKWVGILLINALLILPAAASRNISENMREYHGYAILFALVAGVLGLFSSYFTNVATGPMIVIIASIIYLVTYFYGLKHKL